MSQVMVVFNGEKCKRCHHINGQCHTGPAVGSVAAHNMVTLNLRFNEFNMHTKLMNQKMSGWPESLFIHVQTICNRVGVCGEVIAEAVADWVSNRREL